MNTERIEDLLENLININGEIKNELTEIKCHMSDIKESLVRLNSDIHSGWDFSDYKSKEISFSNAIFKGLEEMNKNLKNIENNTLG